MVDSVRTKDKHLNIKPHILYAGDAPKEPVIKFNIGGH
jgi:hypothetical protein